MSIEHILRSSDDSFGDLSEGVSDADMLHSEQDVFRGIAELALKSGDVETGHEAVMLDEFMHQRTTKRSSN